MALSGFIVNVLTGVLIEHIPGQPLLLFGLLGSVVRASNITYVRAVLSWVLVPVRTNSLRTHRRPLFVLGHDLFGDDSCW
jgi:hypothetical protein